MELLEEDLADGRLDIADAQTPGGARPARAAAALQPRRRAARPQPARRRRCRCARSRSSSASWRARSRPSSRCAPTSATSTLDVVPPRGPCWGRGDPDAVARVVRILLDNALRYGPRGEPIGVTVGCDERHAHVEVADRGPGVHPAEREQIFERFQRGRSAGSEAGFGLGLAIGRELARADGRHARAGRRGRPARHALRARPAGRRARRPSRRRAARPPPGARLSSTVACSRLMPRGGSSGAHGDARSGAGRWRRTGATRSERSAHELRPRRLPAADV